MEKFIVKHYAGQAHPIVKGNGFDGIVLGESKEEAQDFVDFINKQLSAKQTTTPQNAELCEYCGGETYLAPICKKPGCLGQPME